MHSPRAYNHSMDVIYVDSLFILNLIIDYLLCLSAARVCGVYLRRWRYLLASVLGAAYSVAVFLPGCAFLQSPAIKLAAGILMGLVAYGCEKLLLRCILVFLCVSAAFGGTVWAISMAAGVTMLPVSFRVLVFSFALCYAALRIVFDRRAKNAGRAKLDVEMSLAGGHARFFALRDTGNELFDPITGAGVMTVSCDIMSTALPAVKDLFTQDAVYIIQNLPQELAGRFRLIPYNSLGGSGLMPVFRPDELMIDGIAVTDVLVAVSPKPIGGDGYDAII